MQNNFIYRQKFANFSILFILVSESCVSCSSKDEPKCAQHPEQIAPKQCSNHGPEVACYMRIVGGYSLTIFIVYFLMNQQIVR